MKKQYSSPAIKIHTVKIKSILAGSITENGNGFTGSPNGYFDNNQTVNSKGSWDEEWDW